MPKHILLCIGLLIYCLETPADAELGLYSEANVEGLTSVNGGTSIGLVGSGGGTSYNSLNGYASLGRRLLGVGCVLSSVSGSYGALNIFGLEAVLDALASLGVETQFHADVETAIYGEVKTSEYTAYKVTRGVVTQIIVVVEFGQAMGALSLMINGRSGKGVLLTGNLLRGFVEIATVASLSTYIEIQASVELEIALVAYAQAEVVVTSLLDGLLVGGVVVVDILLRVIVLCGLGSCFVVETEAYIEAQSILLVKEVLEGQTAFLALESSKIGGKWVEVNFDSELTFLLAAFCLAAFLLRTILLVAILCKSTKCAGHRDGAKYKCLFHNCLI